MCGIAGLISIHDNAVDRALLQRMIDIIRYRGPDETGIHTEGAVGLAHARLSIIDLSMGRQPMSNENGTLWITFNGEIFNYLELRETLERQGRRFRTRSDTEVILQMYEEKGEECVHEFNGQWAFAIWDAQKQKLFLSRDRLGVRPLFYTTTADAFLFASEVKPLFVHPSVRREVDPVALDQIFTFWVTLPPRTAFRGIHELPPGCSATVCKGKVTVRRYWRPTYPRAAQIEALDEREAVAKLRDLLVEAVRVRLRADVPVGAYISGGLDSSLMAALIQRIIDKRLRTFSVVFANPAFDERAYQQKVVQFLGTSHEEVCCGDEDIGRVFPEVVWHAEKPILRTAPAPLYLLSKLVRNQGYKVVVTGEGADETLGGYDIFKEAKVRRFCAAQPGSSLRPLLLKRLYPYLPHLRSQSVSYLKAFFQATPKDISSAAFSHLPRWDMTSQIKRFFSDDLTFRFRDIDVRHALEQELPNDYGGWHPFCQSQFLETAYLLPGYILSSQGDRMAMAHSVESRFPFLDRRLVDFAAALPPELKMKVLNEKYILKRCAGGLIPAEVAARPKQPYRAPEANAFKGAEAREYVDELLAPGRIRRDGLFHPAAVRKLVEKARQGRLSGTRDNMAFVGILSSQLVMHQFVNHFDAIGR